MDETVCGDPFAWAARNPGRELFAVRGLDKYAGDIDALYAMPRM